MSERDLKRIEVLSDVRTGQLGVRHDFTDVRLRCSPAVKPYTAK
jgi:hypothetical protein